MSDYRVKQSEVKAIIDTDVDDILPFIAIADALVTEKLTGQGLSDELLKEITRWLSAHYVAIRDPRTKRDKTGEAEVEYHMSKVGAGLDATPYGQQVKTIDPSGVLANLGKTQAAVQVIA